MKLVPWCPAKAEAAVVVDVAKAVVDGVKAAVDAGDARLAF